MFADIPSHEAMSTATQNAMSQTSPLAQLSVPVAGGAQVIPVYTGAPVVILGRNGTGKSALVHRLVNQLPAAIYVPGSRPSYFDNESLSLTPASRRQLDANFRSWDSSPDTRWRPISGTQRNEKAIHDLQNAETQYKVDAANDVATHGLNSQAIERLQSSLSPLDRVNALLSQANLPISLSIQQGELKATRDQTTYSIAKMSDGERAALILAAETVTAKDGSVFFIDEPELHLHRSIIVPLLVALISERPQCGFVVSTHELELAPSLPAARLVLVRGSAWENGAPAQWDIDLIEDVEDVPEDLRSDILGSRRRILYIEGTQGSLDQPLYAVLFPKVSIRPRDNCREVTRAVIGLRGVAALHRIEAFGLVDGDGMGPAQKLELEAEGIYALPSYSVESLYYSAEALYMVAQQQASTLGVAADMLLSDAKARALAVLAKPGVKEHLAGRLAERQLRDIALASLPSREHLIQHGASLLPLALSTPYPAELMRINSMASSSDLESIIQRYPVRESGVLGELARGLRFSNRTDYELAVLARLRASEEFRCVLQAKMAPLATCLMT